MVSKDTTVQIGMGFAPVPFGYAKASASSGVDTTTVCTECGGSCGYHRNDEGHFVECQDCGESYSHWSQAAKAYELGDEYIQIDTDDLPEPSVETGQLEKVCDVGDVLLEYAVTGNYYLLPEEEYEEQYGALVNVLDDEHLAILTYLQPHSKIYRYAIISRARRLLALQLADKKELPPATWGENEALEGQAKTLLAGNRSDDPALPDAEDEPIKEYVRSQVEPAAFAPDDEADEEEAEPFAEV